MKDEDYLLTWDESVEVEMEALQPGRSSRAAVHGQAHTPFRLAADLPLEGEPWRILDAGHVGPLLRPVVFRRASLNSGTARVSRPRSPMNAVSSSSRRASISAAPRVSRRQCLASSCGQTWKHTVKI